MSSIIKNLWNKVNTHLAPENVSVPAEYQQYQLDQTGFAFVRKCIEELEKNGLEVKGIYRKSGVKTEISKLLALGMDRNNRDSAFRDKQHTHTIASALKNYLRNLNEPLMTYCYHGGFIEAAKQQNRLHRVREVHRLVHKLPRANFEMLDMVIRHLTEVSRKCKKNEMNALNLGRVFGPTLLRPQEEALSTLEDMTFNIIVIKILIDNYERIFKSVPRAPLLNAPIATGPPTRAPCASEAAKMPTGGLSGERTFLYSQVYRLDSKSNYSDPPVSSIPQNISDVLMYSHGSADSGGRGGGGGGGSISNNTNGSLVSGYTTNGAGGSNNIGGVGSGSKSLGGGVNMGSLKNISVRGRSTVADSVSGILGANTNGAGLSGHHATPAKATNLRHDYAMATTTPAGTSSGGIYSTASTGSNSRLNKNNVAPPSIAMRIAALNGTAGPIGGGSGGGIDSRGAVGVQAQLSRNHMSCAQAKQYSPVAAAASTSSSNKMVYDLLSSVNGICGGGGSNSSTRLMATRGAIDQMPKASQASSPSTLLASTCNDVVMATPASSMIGGGGGSSPKDGSGGYVTLKRPRNQEVQRVLKAGTGRVRTLCAYMEGELSIEPNQIITHGTIPWH